MNCWKRYINNRSSIVDHQSEIIDIGCGSGILAIAALKLGAKTAIGVDIDIESVRNARENADKNGIGAEFIIAQGSVTDVLEGKFPFKQAPLVVTNILAPIIIRLFDIGLADVAEPGGMVILKRNHAGAGAKRPGGCAGQRSGIERTKTYGGLGGAGNEQAERIKSRVNYRRLIVR